MTAGPQPAQAPPPHPDLDTLADLDAGVLAGADAEPVTAHLASCTRCEQVMAALSGVRADLRGLPAPPIPAAVAARLDSALAELRATPDRGRPVAAAARAETAPVADLGTARTRRSRWLKVTTGAAAAVLALFVAGASITLLIRSTGDAGDTSAASPGGGTGPMEKSSAQADSGAGAAAPSPAPSPAPAAAVPSLTGATLRSSLAAIESQFAAARVLTSGVSGPAGRMAEGGRRTACAETIPGHRGVLTAVVQIQYDGQPAYVFVFRDAGKRTAYVVGEQCGNPPSLPAPVLDTVR